MEKSKILLEKIETKKITERYKLDMPEKESRKFKSKLSTRDKVSKEQDLVGISSATYQDLAKIYPKNTDTSSVGNQLPYENLKTREICEVNPNLSKNENKCSSSCFLFQSNMPKSSHQTKSSSSSMSSLSSFVFLETESSILTSNYDKLTDVSDASLKKESYENLDELHAESQRKLLSDSSDASCYNQPIYERHASNKDTIVDKITVQDSFGEKRTGVGDKHFDEEDVEIDSRENSFQVGQDRRTLSMSEEEDPIKELRDALENSTNCLLRCLKSLQNATPRQDDLHLIGDSYMKFDCSTPECKCSETDLKNLITGREDNNSHDPLLISHTLKSKSDTDTKRRIGAVTCQNHSPKSIHTDTTKSECCDCCNRKCFHFQSNRRHLSNDVLEVNTMSKKKMTVSMSQGDFANNLLTSDAPTKISRSSYENNNRCCLPLSDLPISAGKETDPIENETGVSGSFRLTHRSNAGENKQLFESSFAPPEKSNLIKNEQNERHRHKKKKKSKTEQMCRDTDQCEKYTGDNDTKDNDCQAATMLFLAFLFMLFFGFILFIFFFIG